MDPATLMILQQTVSKIKPQQARDLKDGSKAMMESIEENKMKDAFSAGIDFINALNVVNPALAYATGIIKINMAEGKADLQKAILELVEDPAVAATLKQIGLTIGDLMKLAAKFVESDMAMYILQQNLKQIAADLIIINSLLALIPPWLK